MGTVAVVYILFAKIYLFTMIYSLGEGLQAGDAEDIVHALVFTMVFILALVSHIQCVFTNPGILPKDYDNLNERLLSIKFAKLIDERESMHQAAQIRKLMRQGKNEEVERIKQESTVSLTNIVHIQMESNQIEAPAVKQVSVSLIF